MNNNLKYKEQRKEVAYFMRRLYKRGLTTASGGNISLRIDKDIIAITASATDKGRMKWKEVGIMNLEGENLITNLKPSIECEMHLAIYRKSAVTKAIVHAHPPVSSSFAATGRKLDTSLTAEAWAILGSPEIASYALMGTNDLAEIVSDRATHSPVILLENHGVLTTGYSLLQAFERIEVLEFAAKMNVIIKLIGDKKSLGKEKMGEIDKFFR